jgi:hypothetical protein
MTDGKPTAISVHSSENGSLIELSDDNMTAVSGGFQIVRWPPLPLPLPGPRPEPVPTPPCPMPFPEPLQPIPLPGRIWC